MNLNYPVDKFRSFIQSQGSLIWENPKEFAALIDQVIKDYPQENELLVKSLDFCLPQMLKAEVQEKKDMVKFIQKFSLPLAKKLNIGQEQAKWLITTWASALQLIEGHLVKEFEPLSEQELQKKAKIWKSIPTIWKEIFMEHINASISESNWDALVHLHHLHKIDCNEREITDLQALALTPLVTELYLEHTHIEDLTPLKYLPYLQVLDIDETNVSSLAPLKDLKDLRHLSFSYTKVQHLEPIAECEKLEVIEFWGCKINTLQPIAFLKKVQVLYCCETEITTLEPLKGWQELRKLYCFLTNIDSIEPLRGLQNLEELDISNTLVSSLDPLRNMKKLKTLNCSSTKVTSLEPLENCTSLQNLYFEQNDIVSINPLRHLNLKEINWSHTLVTKSDKDFFLKNKPDCKVVSIK